MAVSISFHLSGMITSARTALVAILLAGPTHAQADPQSERTLAMDEVRMAAQAEVLALGCGLRLNTRLRDVLRNDANIKLSAEALSKIALTFIRPVPTSVIENCTF
jgi:hypothetical protein